MQKFIKIIKRIFIIILVGFLVFMVYAYWSDTHGLYKDCKKTSNWFNAKPVTYKGIHYQVYACGDGRGITGDPEEIKVSVYGPDGSLLAVRRFTADYLGTIYPLVYKPSGIEYLDDEKGAFIIQMPPNWLNRIKAYIPIISGSQFEHNEPDEPHTIYIKGNGKTDLLVQP